MLLVKALEHYSAKSQKRKISVEMGGRRYKLINIETNN